MLTSFVGNPADQAFGIGTSAIKVVADCIHSSRIKECGLSMLQHTPEEVDTFDDEGKIRSGETIKTQRKLARACVIFIELLHILLGRNRDLLLTAVEARNRRDASSTESLSGKGGDGYNNTPNFTIPSNLSPGRMSTSHYETQSSVFHENLGTITRGYDDGHTYYGACSISCATEKTDKAMALHSVLQESFISMTRALHPLILRTINSETPRWMKLCCQDNYFSSGTYRQTRIGTYHEYGVQSIFETSLIYHTILSHS